MELLINFINNNWVTSIITGFVVFISTEAYKRFKEKKTYMEQVRQANKEVFNSIKYSIPEEKLPPIVILESIHKATAKRYLVKFEDMDSLNDILDDIIKEIMDSNFLSHDNKLRYSQSVHELQCDFIIFKSKQDQATTTLTSLQGLSFRKEKTRSISFVSLFAALTAGTITTLLGDKTFYEMLTTVKYKEFSLILTTTWLGISFGFMLILIRETIIRLKRKNLNKSIKQDKDENL